MLTLRAFRLGLGLFSEHPARVKAAAKKKVEDKRATIEPRTSVREHQKKWVKRIKLNRRNRRTTGAVCVYDR